MLRLKLSVLTCLTLAFVFTVMYSTISNADPPFKTPPKGGLPMCEETLEEVQEALLSCEFQLFKKVFVTSDTFTADLGGIAGADIKCNDAAAAAGLSGTYKAWISDGTSSPATTFTLSTQPYILLDGSNTRIADDWTDLTTCNEGPGGTDCLDNPVNVDENGNTVIGVVPPTVWSNTLTDGTVDETDAMNTCSSFTRDTGSLALAGSFEAVDDLWTDVFLSLSCGLEARLYCFEQ